jgi:3-hydroxyacyl-CoA dehydrogenase
MSFGMPMGIFKMNDSVGVDIGVHIGSIFKSAYADRLYETGLSQKMVNKNLYGIKSGQGFYKYIKNKATPDLQAINGVLVELSKEGKVPDCRGLTSEQIVEICLLPVVNEVRTNFLFMPKNSCNAK